MRPPTRALVPYVRTYFGGVRRILGLGLPALREIPGIDVTYAELCRNDADMDAIERDGVAVERLVGVPGPSALSLRRGFGRALDFAGQAPRLARVARGLSRRLGAFDVVWVHGHRELLICIAARALSRRDLPIVWHWHGPPLSLGGPRRGTAAERALSRVASRSCARVVAVSGFCAGQAREMGVDPARIVTVLNAASVSGASRGSVPSAPLPARSPGEVTLLVACASLRAHKGVHLAVEALRDLPGNHVLWVTGDTADPPAREVLGGLERIAAGLGVSERVRFIGARPDVLAVMVAADVVLVPSVWEEPFGLVAAEAQLLGVPVVASARGALPEIVADGETGALFDPGTRGALAGAVERLTRDPERMARIAGAARERAESRYSYRRWSGEMAAVLAEAATSPRSVPPNALGAEGDRG